MREVRAVVVKAKNAPATLETILVPDPGPGEALVDVITCGVCQTDLHYELGAVGDDFPYLLGHEASGVVAAAGEGVTEIAVGDKVILNWRAVCGQCRACKKGQLTLPGSAEVLTGHGDTITIGAEAPHLQEWIDRGH